MDKRCVKLEALYCHFLLNNIFLSRQKQYVLRNNWIQRNRKSTGLISDETVRFIGSLSSRKYPDSLRLVAYKDFSTGIVYRFLTNNFQFYALTIAKLYRKHWCIDSNGQRIIPTSRHSTAHPRMQYCRCGLPPYATISLFFIVKKHYILELSSLNFRLYRSSPLRDMLDIFN